MSTSTKTGTRPFWTIGLTVVGKPAATVITSSPGRSAPVAQLVGDVSAASASRFALEPRVDEDGVADADPPGELALELRGEPARRQPEVERRLDQVLHLVGVEDLARHGHRGLAGDESRCPANAAAWYSPTSSRIRARSSARLVRSRRSLPGSAGSRYHGDRPRRDPARASKRRRPAEPLARLRRVERTGRDLVRRLVRAPAARGSLPDRLARIASTSSSTVTGRSLREVERLGPPATVASALAPSSEVGRRPRPRRRSSRASSVPSLRMTGRSPRSTDRIVPGTMRFQFRSPPP